MIAKASSQVDKRAGFMNCRIIANLNDMLKTYKEQECGPLALGHWNASSARGEKFRVARVRNHCTRGGANPLKEGVNCWPLANLEAT